VDPARSDQHSHCFRQLHLAGVLPQSGRVIFEAPEVWSHTAEFLRRTFAEAGFKLEHEQTMFVTAKALAAAGQSGTTGYPAFYQLLSRT